MKSLSETEKAYFAGIIDGEGCIRGQIRHAIPSVSITVAMNVQTVTTQLFEAFGGSLSFGAASSSGIRPQFWFVCGKGLVPVLEATLPYLRVKHVQGELALRFARTVGNGGGNHVRDPREEILRRKLVEAMCELNRSKEGMELE